MEILAYLITQAIVFCMDMLVLTNHASLVPESVEIHLWDLAYFLVTTFHLPIYLGFSQ